MPFTLVPIDQEALNQVEIEIYPDLLSFGDNDLIGNPFNQRTTAESAKKITNVHSTIDSAGGVSLPPGPSFFRLNSSNLQFPPSIKKDSKSANWEEVQSASYEPFKIYRYGNSRNISLEFQWVVGGRFNAEGIHTIISNVKAYYYHAYTGSVNGTGKYPVVVIKKLYGLINSRSTWRMMSLDVKYSDEMVQSRSNSASTGAALAAAGAGAAGAAAAAGASLARRGYFYPLHSVMTLNLEAATQIRRQEGDDTIYNDQQLEQRPKLSWY